MTTFFSTLLGFVFALLLFHITECAKNRREKISSMNLLKRELEYNIILIDEWIISIKHNLYWLTWGKPIYTFSARYGLFQNNFINKALKSGIIYNLLDNKQVKIIIDILTFFTTDRNRYILDIIAKYKDKDTADIDEEGVPTTGKDYIEITLEDELEIIKKMQNDIKQIIPLIKYEETELRKTITQAICFIQKSLKRYN